MKKGMLFAIGAYTCWGLLPLYLRLLREIPALEIMLHRILWSLVFLLTLLALRSQWSWMRETLRKPSVIAGFAASALLLSLNWFLYVWAVNSDRTIDASLGYFINPLVNVLLGFLLLRERMRPIQWSAIGIAAAGVVWLTLQAGQLPWIGLALALTFGTYGLLRKTAVLGPLEGLTLETMLLSPFAAGYLLWLSTHSANHFVTSEPLVQVLLLAAGPITAIPLLMFAAGARRIPLSLLGLLQYIGPTLQLITAVWLFHEPFSASRMIGFAMIWSALALYSAESLWQSKRAKQTFTNAESVE